MILRLSITVLNIFVKKCFLKKYAEGYKSEVATKAFFSDEMFYRISHLDFNWNTSILIKCSTNTIIYIRMTFRV